MPATTRNQAYGRFEHDPKKVHVLREGMKDGHPATIVLDFNEIPSRGATLVTRATWAHRYLERFVSGERATEKNLKLATKWLGEFLELHR